MCLPTKTDPSSSAPGSGARSLLGVGGLMLVACLGGPVLAGGLGGLGLGVALGIGGAAFALAVCGAVPALVVAWRRRSSRRQPTPGSGAATHLVAQREALAARRRLEDVDAAFGELAEEAREI
jgi:predicted lipid-binding transport protein (Tim44 family)